MHFHILNSLIRKHIHIHVLLSLNVMTIMSIKCTIQCTQYYNLSSKVSVNALPHCSLLILHAVTTVIKIHEFVYYAIFGS